MGSINIPPPHIPSHVLPVCTALLQVGGTMWTICYILLWRQSIVTRSYGMPLFALAYNFSWELVNTVFVAEHFIEKVIYSVWLAVDCGMVYGVLKYGRGEWEHAPLIAKRLGTVILVLVVYTAVGHWAFVKWWIDNEVGRKEGKFYKGVLGPDMDELGFWTVALSQAILSSASLGQLVIRQHSGGVSWGIWATRTLGSVTGIYLFFGWAWYFWREAHAYFMSPFGIFLWGTGFICDFVYPFVLYQIQQTEKTLPDGRKVRGDDIQKNRMKAR